MSDTSDKSVIQCIREFIKGCPYLPEFRKSIGVDYLSPEVQSYMIEAVPCEPVVKRYITGETVQQYRFYFSSREAYSSDVLANLENSMFYEHFQDWLETCTRSGQLPEMTGGKSAQQIMATTQGYVYDADLEKAQYNIQCRLVYFCP